MLYKICKILLIIFLLQHFHYTYTYTYTFFWFANIMPQLGNCFLCNCHATKKGCTLASESS